MSIDIPDFLSEFNESDASVRARYDNDADPTLDTLDGGFYQLLTQPGVMENARQWMSMNDVLQNSSLLWAVAPWLDYKAAEWGISRKSPTYASGTVTFTGDPGTDVPAGTVVSAPTTSDAQPVLGFLTLVDATVDGGGSVDVLVQAESTGSAYNLSATSVTFIQSNLSHISAVNNADPMTSGSDVEDDDTLRQRVMLSANTPQAAGAVGDYERWCLAYDGVGAVTVTPLWNGANTVECTLLDEDNNPVSQSLMDLVQDGLTGDPVVADPGSGPTVAAGASGTLTGTYHYRVTFYNVSGAETHMSPDVSVTVTSKQISLTNLPVGPAGTVGRKIYRAGTTSGPYLMAHNVADNTTLTYTDNTATITDTGVNHGPMTNNTSGWTGLAPIGHIVRVDTPSEQTIAVVATITPKTGYTLDGTAGTIAIRSSIEDAVAAYIGNLAPGDDVIYQHVIAAMFVTGVIDLTGPPTVSGGTTNVAISTSAVAVPGTVTLT